MPFFTEGGVDVRGRCATSNPTSGCHSLLEGKFSPDRIVIEFFIEGMLHCRQCWLALEPGCSSPQGVLQDEGG